MKLKYDEMLSNLAFNFNLRRYNAENFLYMLDAGLDPNHRPNPRLAGCGCAP